MDAFQMMRRGTARDAFAGVLLQRANTALAYQPVLSLLCKNWSLL
jgi:hypothetical protein